MGSSEKFCLRWNDFESNISVAFRELREEKDFFDVTLACDDSQIQAHKVILSACSPFFRNVLRRNPHQHPLLYLKGVKYQELLSVLNFMYMGEVNVAQEELNSFLAVAEDLRVKGLTQNNPGTGSSTKQEPTKQNHRVAREPPDREAVQHAPKRPRPTPPPPPPRASFNPPQDVQEADDDIQEVVPVKSEPRDAVVVQETQHQQYQHQANTVEVQGRQQGVQQNTEVALDTEQYGEESYDYGQYGDGSYDDGGAGVIDPNTGLPMQQGDGTKGATSDDLKSQIMSKILVSGKPAEFQCTECGHVSSLKANMMKHVEAKHMSGQSLSCQYCGRVCPSTNALASHVSRYHRFNKYQA